MPNPLDKAGGYEIITHCGLYETKSLHYFDYKIWHVDWNVSDKDPRGIYIEAMSHCNAIHTIFLLFATEKNEHSDVTQSSMYYLL